MKREKLFRGFDPNMKEWVYGSYLHTDTNINECIGRRPIREIHSIMCYFSGDWNMGGWAPVEVLPETVGQFTGFTVSKNHPMFDDKIKLWEDDVFTVDSSKAKYRVVFENYEWIGISNEGDDWGKFKYRLSAIGKKQINIVGNIHDNIELFE